MDSFAGGASDGWDVFEDFAGSVEPWRLSEEAPEPGAAALEDESAAEEVFFVERRAFFVSGAVGLAVEGDGDPRAWELEVESVVDGFHARLEFHCKDTTSFFHRGDGAAPRDAERVWSALEARGDFVHGVCVCSTEAVDCLVWVADGTETGGGGIFLTVF